MMILATGTSMKRRTLIMLLGGAATSRLCSPLRAIAQQSPGKVWRVAFVLPGAWDNPVDRALFDLFREELQKLGYLDAKNLVIDRRGAEGHNERLFSLISELIALGPDVIVAVGVPPTDAARRATSTIPIVMWGTNDPVGAGFIKSLAHPGGNVTGVAGMFADSIGKAVELLRAVLPTAKRMAVLTSSNPNHPRQYELAEAAGKALGRSKSWLLHQPISSRPLTEWRRKSEMLSLSLLTQYGQPSFRWRQRRRYRQFINSALMSI